MKDMAGVARLLHGAQQGAAENPLSVEE